MDEHGHVDQFVLGCPSEVCILGDPDVAELRSSSTKDGTSCPVSCLSALDHLQESMGGMVDLEVDQLDLVA